MSSEHSTLWFSGHGWRKLELEASTWGCAAAVMCVSLWAPRSGGQSPIGAQAGPALQSRVPTADCSKLSSTVCGFCFFCSFQIEVGVSREVRNPNPAIFLLVPPDLSSIWSSPSSSVFLPSSSFFFTLLIIILIIFLISFSVFELCFQFPSSWGT